MKKLTAGIFAGILTIVTVNAADAAIATSGYVQEQVGAVDKKVGTLNTLTTTAQDNTVAAINEVNATVKGHTTSISGLQETVGNLTGDGADSVAGQIASALGGTYSGENTVKAALELKADKATVGTPDSGKTVVQMIKDVQTAAGTDVADKLGGAFSKDSTVQDALNLKADKAQLGDGFTSENTVATAIDNITKTGGTIDTKISTAKSEIKETTDGLGARLTTAEGKITANTNAITTLNGDGEGSVNKKIETAIAGVNTAAEALEGRVSTNETAIAKLDGTDTVEGSVKKQIKDAIAGVDTKLADKQNLLNGTNVRTTGDGNAIVSITAADGVVTATTGDVIPEVTTIGQTGTYVLTATVNESGVTNYMWESIERAAAQSENP